MQQKLSVEYNIMFLGEQIFGYPAVNVNELWILDIFVTS